VIVMRRLIAAISIMLCLVAGCGRTAMATGAVLTMVGGVGIAAGASTDDSSSCEGDTSHGCWNIDVGAGLTAIGVRSLVLGLVLLGGGYAIAKAEDRRDEPPPPPQPAPRLSADDPRRTGVWRDVPAVPGDDVAE